MQIARDSISFCEARLVALSKGARDVLYSNPEEECRECDNGDNEERYKHFRLPDDRAASHIAAEATFDGDTPSLFAAGSPEVSGPVLRLPHGTRYRAPKSCQSSSRSLIGELLP